MSAKETADIRLTFGAMLIGSFISVYLCGIGGLQTYRYFLGYRRRDPRMISLTVFAVWIIDLIHTILICQAMWDYLVLRWGDPEQLDHLDWTIGASIAATGLVTFIVQLFFTNRVWRFSNQNIYLGLTIVSMVIARLASAIATTIKMIQLGEISTFINEFRWLFTFGLALSCAIEILLTSALCYYLRVNRSVNSTMDEVIHKLFMYSISNGVVTTLGTLLAMLFAAIVPRTFLFLALHFIISKCYVNSFLATLNSRDALKKRHSSSDMAFQISVEGHSQPRFRRFTLDRESNEHPIQLSDTNKAGRGRRSSFGDLKVQVHIDRETHEGDSVIAKAPTTPDGGFKTTTLPPGQEGYTTVTLPRLS